MAARGTESLGLRLRGDCGVGCIEMDEGVVMTYPWQGAARRMDSGKFDEVGRRYNLAADIIKAVFEVESAGDSFRVDGSLERRYEPHHFPGSGITNWRDSLKLKKADRDARFIDAYRRHPEKALDASSWGGPQIMGFNAEAAGYASAAAMVTAMAADETEHLTAFMRLIDKWGLVTVLRAHDWERFAARYNGSGQAAVYARKIESAYRKHSAGMASPVVLRLGRAGNADAVRELQRALGIEVDGDFGPETDNAVRAFQRANRLKDDGIVGAETWGVLRDRRDAQPKAQQTQADIAAKVTAYSGAAAGAVAAIGDALPETAVNILVGGATAAGIMAAAAFIFVKMRRASV